MTTQFALDAAPHYRKLKTARQLEDFLTTTRINMIKNKNPDSERAKIGREVKHLLLEDPEVDKNTQAIAMFDNDGTFLSGMVDYWDLRDAIHFYQRRENISSIAFSDGGFKGENFYFPDHCGQLLEMPQDLAIMARHKDRVVAYFLDFVKRYNLPLFQEVWENNESWYEDASPDQILHKAFQCNTAMLTYCLDNQPAKDKNGTILFYYSKYGLRVNIGLGDDSQSFYFEAYTQLTV